MIRFISYLIHLIIGLIMSLLFTSCHYKVEVDEVFSSMEGSENIISETRNVSDFDKIKVSQAIQVEIIQANTFDVEVEVNDNIMPYLKTEVSNGELKIFFSKKFNSFRNVDALVKIKMPHLKSVKASSATGVTSKGLFAGDDLQIDVSSAASVKMQTQYDDIAVDASSASSVELSGLSLFTAFEASSAASIDAKDLKANEVKADVSSGANISTWPIILLDADASSGGSIKYYNSPSKDLKKSASSGGRIDKY